MWTNTDWLSSECFHAPDGFPPKKVLMSPPFPAFPPPPPRPLGPPLPAKPRIAVLPAVLPGAVHAAAAVPPLCRFRSPSLAAPRCDTAASCCRRLARSSCTHYKPVCNFVSIKL